MTDRITNKQLQALVDQINKATGSPMTPWTRDAKGILKANIGNYHLSGAYGGVCLHRIMSQVEVVLVAPVPAPHRTAGEREMRVQHHALRIEEFLHPEAVAGRNVPKRELYNAMRAFLTGLEYKRDK